MQIVGIGTDITECDRIERMLRQHLDSFLSHVFTEQEIRYSQSRKRAVEHFTGRWAAKEAVLKTLGTGWIAGISWKDVEILNEPGGKPYVTLSGGAKKHADSLGIREILVSISHCRSHATATAIAVN